MHLSFASRSVIHICMALTILGFRPIATFAQGTIDGLEIQANEVSRDYEARVVTLEGNVRIGFGTESLSCKKAIIYLKKQTIIAEGSVVLESKDTFIEGEKIEYNYKTKLGEIHKGYVQSGQAVFIGELIKKNSEKDYVAHSAKFTSCATCPPAWSFTGSKIEAELGGYADIKYPVLRFGNVPVFILPRIWVPLKSERQSGLLVPSIDYSSVGGTAFTLPYYFAIDRSQDLTYSLKTYEKRGLKHLAEYRYALAENSTGQFNSAFLSDEAYSPEGKSTGPTQIRNRGFLTYTHYYEMPEDYIHRANLNIASDLRYPRDFSDEMPGHGDPALENKTSLTKNSESQHFSVEAAYYTNLLKEDAFTDNSDSVHRFPEVQYSLMETELLNTNLFLTFDFNYTNFSRRDFAYDDVVKTGTDGTPTTIRDGTFDYDTANRNFDRIRTGHRYIFQPAISYPFHIGNYLDVNPTVIYNETQYRFNVDPATPISDYERNAELRYVQTDLSLKTKYSAVFGKDDKIAPRYKHEIEPEVIYSRIPVAERPEHVFFGNFEDQPYSRRYEPVSDSDFFGDSGLQFDYRDRLFDKDLATFVLSNYLIKKTYNGSLSNYQKFTTFRVSQSYDLNEARDEVDSKPWSAINSLLDIRLKNFETHTTADTYLYAKVTNWSTRVKLLADSKDYLQFKYSRNVIIDENQESTGQKNETLITDLGFVTKFLDLIGRTDYSLITEEINSWEYIAVMKPPGDCWSIKFGHKQTLGSDTVFKFSIEFEFSDI